MLNDLFELSIVDEDVSLSHMLASLLEPSSFKVQMAQSLQDALADSRSSSCDFLLIGFQGPGTLSLQQLRHTIQSMSETRVVAMVSEQLESYEELLRQAGVHQVISREISPKQIAQYLVAQSEILNLEKQNYHLRQMLDNRVVYGNLIGGSPPMRALYRLLDQIARTDAPVLVSGEEGTERIDIARAIHQKSDRAIHPAVVIDCSEGLTDHAGSFLFGPQGNGQHSNGPSKGSAFARAGKGTLVLHRIELLSQDSQRRLLDFLHHPFFQNETPGSPLPLARIIATAGSNLLGRVEAGEFLRELFYRLNILQVRVPPLRERREDIPMLAQHFLRSADRKTGGRPGAASFSFSSRAILQLFQYDWPGNLAELSKVIGAVAASAQGPQIEMEDLPESLRQLGDAPAELSPSSPMNISLKEAKRIFESEYFKGLLKRTQGNMTMASRFSRVGRPYLYKKIREYGLQPEEYR